MKITKRQLKRIIKEERSKILTESTHDDAARFKEIMVELAELVDEAFYFAGRSESARQYWYNGILARIDPEAHGMVNRSYSMKDTYEELGGDEAKMEDMMEQGYNDGLEGEKPKHPDNEYYMVNYRDGVDDAAEL